MSHLFKYWSSPFQHLIPIFAIKQVKVIMHLWEGVQVPVERVKEPVIWTTDCSPVPDHPIDLESYLPLRTRIHGNTEATEGRDEEEEAEALVGFPLPNSLPSDFRLGVVYRLWFGRVRNEPVTE
jgi:hypothetical protein